MIEKTLLGLFCTRKNIVFSEKLELNVKIFVNMYEYLAMLLLPFIPLLFALLWTKPILPVF
jgi:hypothetical protein